MNTLFRKTTWIIALLAASISAQAATSIPDLTIVSAGMGKQFGLSVQGLEASEAVFTVSKANGEVVLTKRIAHDNFRALFSLERMEEGSYLFTLKTAEATIQQPFHLTQRGVLYDESLRVVEYLTAQ